MEQLKLRLLWESCGWIQRQILFPSRWRNTVLDVAAAERGQLKTISILSSCEGLDC